TPVRVAEFRTTAPFVEFKAQFRSRTFCPYLHLPYELRSNRIVAQLFFSCAWQGKGARARMQPTLDEDRAYSIIGSYDLSTWVTRQLGPSQARIPAAVPAWVGLVEPVLGSLARVWAR